MFRTTAIRIARHAFRSRPNLATASLPFRPAAIHSIRLNSSQPPNAADQPTEPETPKTRKELIKEALEKQDDLQRDWDHQLVITYADFLPKTENPLPDAYIIDVREPDEVIQGMIPSAVNLPLSVLGAALQEHTDVFEKKYGFRKPLLDQEVVFYCRSGMRSSTATDVAKRNGYTNIFNYKGSWLEWTAKQNEKTSA